MSQNKQNKQKSRRRTATKYIDHLNEDDPISGQSWVCISFLSPEGIKNCSMRGLKIRGVYATAEEANKRAKYLQSVDPDFHVFVGQVGKWLPWDPDVNTVEDQQFVEKQLNDLMIGYKENREKSKKMEAQRKRDMLAKAARQEKKVLSTKKKDNKNNKNNKNKKKKKKKKNNMSKKEKTLKKADELIKDTSIELSKQRAEIKKDESSLSDIDKKINRVQELYRKLKNKEKK